MTKPPSFDVFMSYNSNDRSTVLNISDQLASRGVQSWIDVRQIAPGRVWQEELEEIIANTRSAAVFVGKHGIGPWESPEIRACLSEFINRRMPVIPVLLPDAPEPPPKLPFFLREFKWVDLRKDLTTAGLDSLIWGITGRRPEAQGSVDNRGRLPSQHGVRVLIPGRTILVLDSEYCFVPGGRFPMGSNEGYPHESPRHSVVVPAFFLKATPVTVREFQHFVDDSSYITAAETRGAGLGLQAGTWTFTLGTSYHLPLGIQDGSRSYPDHPVVQVSWFDAREYCFWLSRRSGFPCDLPSESQWEFAAAGSEGAIWSKGDDFESAQYSVDCGGTKSVGARSPNRFGLYDMTGNVYEWCLDWYSPHWAEAGHSSTGVTLDPAGPAEGRDKVLRGGSWFDSAHHCRNTHRFSAEPTLSAANWGFRPLLHLSGKLLAELTVSGLWPQDTTS